MVTSLNLVFTGVASEDEEFPHPPGLSVVRTIASVLRDQGWSLSDYENWRDCGWSLECSQKRMTLFLAFAQTSKGGWMLQISPLRVPGLLAGLFGAKPSATPQDVLAAARSVHSIISRQSGFNDLRWRWDGYPDASSSSLEPLEPPSA